MARIEKRKRTKHFSRFFFCVQSRIEFDRDWFDFLTSILDNKSKLIKKRSKQYYEKLLNGKLESKSIHTLGVMISFDFCRYSTTHCRQ